MSKIQLECCGVTSEGWSIYQESRWYWQEVWTAGILSDLLQSIVTFSHLLNDHLVQLKFAIYFYRFMIIPRVIFQDYPSNFHLNSARTRFLQIIDKNLDFALYCFTVHTLI